MRANREIREQAKRKGVFLWQIAEKYPLSDANFSKLLRRELSPEKKARVLSIIEELAAETRKEA
mgnify:CR=1 FL=1